MESDAASYDRARERVATHDLRARLRVYTDNTASVSLYATRRGAGANLERVGALTRISAGLKDDEIRVDFVAGHAMSEARALEVTAACVAHNLAREGLRDGELPDLSGVSLADLIEANRIVRELPGVKGENGMVSKPFNCDDRFVAALYVALHYDGDDDAQAVTPVAAAGGKLVIVLTEDAVWEET